MKIANSNPKKWLVTGAAGFIGMHLVKALIKEGHSVCGVDSFITGHRSRLEDLKKNCTPEEWQRFEFREGDLSDLGLAMKACEGVDVILHQAALGSVPRSIKDPLSTHQHNVNVFMNVIWAARENKVRRFVYASSSSVYGDNPVLPKKEDKTGNPLSPYAASKKIDEIYAQVFQRTYGLECIGLRYFNVFGPAQDPNGPYAAVIPLWIRSLLKGEDVFINGDGSFSRDFCYVDNVVQANLLAGIANQEATGKIYNIACGDQTNLNELYQALKEGVAKRHPEVSEKKPIYRAPREGDIPHSLADIEKARQLLGYQPRVKAKEGLGLTVDWYLKNPFMLG